MGRPQEGESPWSLRETTEERPASPPPSLFCTSILDDDIICPPPAEESDSSPPRSPVEGALRETCLDGALRETWGTIEKHKATLLRKKHEKRKPPRKAREVVTLAREAATPAATAEPGAAPDAEASRRDLLQERTRQSVLARSLKEEIGDALYQQCEKSFYSRTARQPASSVDVEKRPRRTSTTATPSMVFNKLWNGLSLRGPLSASTAAPVEQPGSVAAGPRFEAGVRVGTRAGMKAGVKAG